MAFEGLSDKLTLAFKRLKSKGKLSETDVKEAMREVRLALLEADVNYKVAKDFAENITQKCIGEQVMESLTPAQMVVKIVDQQLTELMGSQHTRINTSPTIPTIILMCGLNGAGKTTHAAKLAKLLKTKGHRPLLVACDIYRPAAIKQLQVMGERAGTQVFEKGTQDPIITAQEAIKHAKDYGNDYVILDTAGRLHVDEVLMDELIRMKEAVKPNEIMLVIDSMTGQDAVNVAQTFNDLLDIHGVIITKLDSDTRGGVALSVRAVTGKPIKFAGTGEKIEDFEEFHPERMASRILGMGDVLSLIEKAETQIDQKDADAMAKKMQNNSFDMSDLLDQFKQIKKMGSLKQIIGMLPGVDKSIKDVDLDEKLFDRIEAIIYSMTAKERAKPEIITPSRKRRIASGSGTEVQDVNKLLKQFEQMKKMFKQMGGKGKKRGMRMPMMPPGMKF